MSVEQDSLEMDSTVKVGAGLKQQLVQVALSIYSSNKSISTDIDECAQGLDRCHEHAMCTNTRGGYTCECRAGFTGDGFNCQGGCRIETTASRIWFQSQC